MDFSSQGPPCLGQEATHSRETLLVLDLGRILQPSLLCTPFPGYVCQQEAKQTLVLPVGAGEACGMKGLEEPY